MKKYFFLSLIALAALITAGASATIASQQQQSAMAWTDPYTSPATERKAPIVTSDDNVYIVWWTDKGMPNANGELLFRSSSDSGSTFGEKINLSNTTDADSIDAEVAVEGDNVFITWWERNATSNEPVMKISTDNGQTFGPMLRLATNGTIGSISSSNTD